MKLTLLLASLLGLAACGPDKPKPDPYITLGDAHVQSCNDQSTRMDVLYKNGAMQVVDWSSESKPPYCDTWNQSTWWSIVIKYDTSGRPTFVNAKQEK